MSKAPDPGLKVRVYNIAHQNFDGHQDLGNCVLSQLVLDAQDKIIAVKVDDDLLRVTGDRNYNLQAYFSQLDRLNLGKCTEVLLASGGTVYMSEPEVAAQVRDRFFASQPDHCCRYGSLLVSSCTVLKDTATHKGIASLDRPITVKIVDFEHESEMERKVAKDLRVGDCHGKISPRLAKMLGGEENTPFQFRLANYSLDSPLPSFIAKGTVAIDSRRTENRGYDLVLDRSSIKGWANNTGPMQVSQINNQWRLTPKPNLNQQQLADLDYLPTILQNHGVQYQINPKDRSYILHHPSKQALDVLAHAYDWGRDRLACGVYQMPEVVLGNNSNAELQDYRNSWQLTQWYSPQAIEQDIVPATVAEAEYLKSIQNDYRLLAQYLVKNHDQKQKLKNLEEEEIEDKNEFGLIEVLRADTRGELANHPKIVSFCRDQLRKRWLELATKGANTLESAMAQPADIKPGTVIAPHLISGSEVIVTRYPIINKDNIRRYDDRVFSSAPMPVPENGSVVDILPRHINQIWSSCELKEMPVNQYKHLLQSKGNIDDTAKAAIAQLSSNILQQYNDNVKLIVREKVSDPQQIKERFARTYAGIKEQIMTAQLSSVAKDELAATLWQKQHNNSSETSCRRKCIDICRHFDPSIYSYQKEKHQYRRDLIKDQPAYIVEAPFESSLFASQGRKDCAVYIKEMLDAQSQDFEATVHSSKPCVVFAIKNIAPHVKQLFEPFHDPQIARHHDLIDLKQARQSLFNSDYAPRTSKADRQLYNKLFTFTSGTKKYNPVSIVAPRHMNWLIGQTSRKASLVFSVLPERVSQALGREISQVQLLGKDKNAYAQHDFNSAYYQGRQLNFFVSTFNDPNSDRHGDPMVYMQNPGDGNYYSLGMFSQDSNKLPVSVNFKAQATSDGKTVELSIEPGSIIIPQPVQNS